MYNYSKFGKKFSILICNGFIWFELPDFIHLGVVIFQCVIVFYGFHSLFLVLLVSFLKKYSFPLYEIGKFDFSGYLLLRFQLFDYLLLFYLQ